MPAWNYGYHVTANTYGTWLHASALGFRTRHHREHIVGDYETPPPAGAFDRRRAAVKATMSREPVHVPVSAALVACRLIAKSLRDDEQPFVCLTLDDHHLHLLVKCVDDRPRHWIGRAKGRTARALSKFGVTEEGGLFAKRCLCKPINDRAHQLATVPYIMDHTKRGAAGILCLPDRTVLHDPMASQTHG